MTSTSDRSHWLAIGLLLVLFAQLATSSTVKSPVFDEPLHTARAYYVTVTGNWDMQAGHLPLLYRLLGPLFWGLGGRPAAIELPQSNDHVEMARDVIDVLNHPWDSLIFPLRVVVMGLTLLLGATLYRWAGERHGEAGGLLALFVYAFSPNILAHGRLVTTDLVVACFFFMAVYTFQRLLARPTVGRCASASLCLGLALGSKASALLLLPALVLLLICKAFAFDPSDSHRSSHLDPRVHQLALDGLWLALTGLAAGVIVWLLYGLETGSWSEGWPALPLPSYMKTLFQVGEHGATRGHPAFLMGERSGGGWLAYFPIALMIKTPLPTLIGTLVGTTWLVRERRWWACLTGLLPGALLFGAAVFSSLNIGYRHILPVVPFMILLLSASVDLPRHRLPLVIAGGGLALWLVAGTLGIYPDYLAYFNALVGGPRGGRRYLTDSNLDWGQDLKQLTDYLAEQDIEHVHLSYFGNVDPAAYGIHYEPLPSHFPIGEVEDFAPFAPEPGIYAISITNLSGQYLIENPTVLDWFNHQDPIASIGHSINVYSVEPDPAPPTWAGLCQAPGAPLDSNEFARQAGRDELRFVAFDCRSSWIFADGGRPAWLAVPATEETDNMTPPAGSLVTTYEQENYGGKLLFTVYRWNDVSALEGQLNDLLKTPALPARLGDTLTLLGLEIEEESEANSSQLAVRSYWRVLEQPDQPLSLMAHLSYGAGEPTAIGDALDVPIYGWAAGDVIVQEHRLPLASETVLEHADLQLGAYWLPSMERLPALDRRGDPLPQNVVSVTHLSAETTP